VNLISFQRITSAQLTCKGLTEKKKRCLFALFPSTVPKLGFGTAGLFEDTKSSVLSALNTGYRYFLLLVNSIILFTDVWPNDICDVVVEKKSKLNTKKYQTGPLAFN